MFYRIPYYLFPILIWICTINLTAHITDYYSFSTGQGDYTEITGTGIPSIQTDDAISGLISIGFAFPYGTNSYSQVKVSSNGYISLGGTMGSIITNSLISTAYCPLVSSLWDDLDMVDGNVQYLLSGTAPQRVFTIQFHSAKWDFDGANQFNFQTRLFETGRIELCYGSHTGTPSNPSASIGMNMQPGGVNHFYSITPGTPATASATTDNNLVNVFPAGGTKYIFSPPVPNDMAALSISGNTYIGQGTVNTYTVNIRNDGTIPQSNYTVKLMTGTTELASAAGQLIQPQQTLPFQVIWIPWTDGPMQIYGKVVLPGDANPLNDQTDSLSILILPPGSFADEVGNGSEQHYAPYNFCFGYSLYETLYYPSELNTVGIYNGIMFYSNLAVDLPGSHISLWLGTTTQPNLENGWIPSTQLTQVFDGTIDFLHGSQGVYIDFQTPFAYTGNNLVLMAKHGFDPIYFTNQLFFNGQTSGTNRARLYNSDTVNPDPTNPQSPGTLSGQFPQTTFLYVENPNTSLQGNVTSNGTALQGAIVTIANTAYQCTTNPQGHYLFPILQPGSYEVTAAKTGYVSQTQTAVIVLDQVTFLNFDLDPGSLVNVSGMVCGSDSPTVGLLHASVVLEGETTYSTVTDATGHFAIPGVAAGITYQYTISCTGYDTATGSIVVGNTNLNMGNIILSEIVDPPTIVLAIDNPNLTVTISWQPVAGPAGYKVWRLLPGQENNEAVWTMLTPQTITGTFFVDTSWLHNETTLWAVKAVYTNNVTSLPAFSNPIVIPSQFGRIEGFVRNSIDQTPVNGAEVMVVNSTYFDLSDDTGFYRIWVWAGNHGVHVTATGYADTTLINIHVVAGQPTPFDISLRPLTANQDETLVPIGILNSYPNPFTLETEIQFSVKTATPVTLEVFNLKGQKVKSLLSNVVSKGNHTVSWNGRSDKGDTIQPGMYFLTLKINNQTYTRKLLKL